MSVVTYERVGGFAGFRDVLRVDEAGELEVSRRSDHVSRRPLTAGERRRLQELLQRAKAAPAPPESESGRRYADAFDLSLTLDGEPTPRVRTTTPGSPDPVEGPWMALMAWLDELLASEIARAP